MLRRLSSAVLIALAGTHAASAQSPEKAFAGKTVRIIHGATVGGEYDVYAKLAARHIGQFIPGKPTVIVQAMPGAGGLTAIRYMATAAPRDGTVILMPQVNLVHEGMLTTTAQYDPGAFQWIGRMLSQVQVGLVSERSGVTSLEGAKSKELIAGGYGNNPTTQNPRLLNRLIGTKFRIVAGYKGTGDAMLAWERGEVDVITNSWDVMISRYSDQIKRKAAIPLYVNAVTRPEELSTVPLMTDFGQTDADRAFLQIYAAGAGIGRSLAAPPGVTKEQVETWRTAFTRMLDDHGFKESVRAGGLRLDPLNGAAMEMDVRRVVGLPSENVEKAKKFYDELLAAN